MKRLREIRHFALDLDGTLYLGGKLLEWTPGFLRVLSRLGLGRTFFTNNSSRSTEQYVTHLREMGIDAQADEVVVSTHSMLEYLKQQQPDVRRLFVLGTPSLQRELAAAGYELCADDPGDEPDAVIVGFDTTLSFERACRAAHWIRSGKLYVATHPDRVCPTDQPTVLVDCGAVCAMLTSATGREPDAVLGKPHPLMLAGVLRRQGLEARQLAVVGDRLYTDLAMARCAGAMGILVLSGETTRREADQADPPPDLVVENVGELTRLLCREQDPSDVQISYR